MRSRLPLFDEAGDAAASGGGAAAGAGGSSSATLLSGASSAAASGSGSGSGAATQSATQSSQGAESSASVDWRNSLDESLRAHPSLRAIQSPADLAKAYVETKGMVGKRLEMPGEGATPEQLSAWRKVVGAPDDPKGYLGDAKSLRPDVIPEGMWSAENEQQMLAVMHKHHLSPQAAKDIFATYANQIGAGLKFHEEQAAAHLQTETANLQKEWGGQFEANLTLAARVADTVGLPKDHPAFTNADVIKAFARMGRLISETSLVKGDTSSAAGGGFTERIQEIQDPKSQATIAREYRGEFGPERQNAAAEALRGLLAAQSEANKKR